MQSIIELLYKGDIRGVSLKLPADRRDKELSYYDKIGVDKPRGRAYNIGTTEGGRYDRRRRRRK